MIDRDIRSCFVTGGTGFIGSHLVDHLLKQGVKVRCLVRRPSKLRWLAGRPVQIIQGDLASDEALAAGVAGVDAVFHLAGLVAAGSREEYFRVNADGCRSLVKAVGLSGGKTTVLVYVSSLAASGPSEADGEVTEEDSPAPITSYGMSKLEGERALEAASGRPIVIVRPPAVYGPRDREILPFFRMGNRGFFPIINSGARISLVHVEDLAKGIYRAACYGGPGEAYFITGHETVRISDMPRFLSEALGKKVRGVRISPALVSVAAGLSEAWGRIRGRMPVFNRDKARELAAPGWVCSSAKALRDLSFQAEISIKDGFSQTARWYRENNWIR
ncbi:MAG: NAD-dependent epimerase/dehydratase family protein [Deltaproteobacteria bacterium]|nr:NAD-dependent epimerase/dehydratase family protein [Deltaproteobacteria bacterium]